MKWAEDRLGKIIYRTFEDGTCIAYGPEREPLTEGDMIASAWSAHPQVDGNAKHLGHIAVDARPRVVEEKLVEWEDVDRRENMLM